MKRKPLPQRRFTETKAHFIGGLKYHVSVGFYDDGSPGEVFISTGKIGTDAEHIAKDITVLISIMLQYGFPVPVIAKSIDRVVNEKGEMQPASIVGLVADALTEYVASGMPSGVILTEVDPNCETRAAIDKMASMMEVIPGVPEEIRTNPAFVVVEPSLNPVNPPVATKALETRSIKAFSDMSKMQGYTGDACGECGNYTLVRNGTCLKCNTCGATSGCS